MYNKSDKNVKHKMEMRRKSYERLDEEKMPARKYFTDEQQLL